jgi:hypothetical protein
MVELDLNFTHTDNILVHTLKVNKVLSPALSTLDLIEGLGRIITAAGATSSHHKVQITSNGMEEIELGSSMISTEKTKLPLICYV